MGKQQDTRETQGETAGTALVPASNSKVLMEALKRNQRGLLSLLGSEDMASRAARVALVLVRRTPDLQECSVESVVNGLLQSAQYGLELGTEAHLVPFYNKELKIREAVFVPDWKGLVRLAIGAGSIVRGHADLVYQGDEFAYERTEAGVLFRHVRQRFGTRAKTDTVDAHVKAGCQGVYFIGYAADAPPVVAMMPVDEVEYVRKTYSKQADGPLWSKRWSAAACKTVTKQGLKLVRMTPKLQQVIELDNRQETGIKSGVLDEDEVEVRPFTEPRPLAPGKSAEQEEADVREEDKKLAQE